MTARRAALIAALVAALVYLPALGNRFALDDGAIVERNAAAHSIGTALGAFAHPYWPPEHGAGLWRPLVILSFAVDWQLSGGNAAWLHATNILLHALATALVVFVIAAYVAPAAALAGGLLFAVHPVHVEAVANLVGRAELLAACFVLAALLAGRVVRRRVGAGRPSAPAEAALLAALVCGLLAKEHAVVTIALLWLDERTRPGEPGRIPVRTYALIAAVTLAWLVVRRLVEGGLGFDAVAPTFFHLDAWGRISTMLPAVLTVVRLLVWPFDLSPDYHPRVIERLEQPTLPGVLGLVVLAALVTLALLLWRRHRVTSLGLLLIGIAWLPTANLLFPTGIALAERTLYLPSVGVAVLAGVGVAAIGARLGAARGLLVAATLCVPLAARTWTRIPAWRTTRDLVVTALLEHPESYKVHQTAARVYWRLGMRAQALEEYGTAAELYPLDHYFLAEYGSGLIEGGRVRQALRVLRQAENLDSNYTLTQQLLAQALIRVDSAPAALPHARRGVANGPTNAEASRVLTAAYLANGLPDSALAVWPAFARAGGSAFDRWLLEGMTFVALGRTGEARRALDSASARVPSDTTAQRRLREALAEAARPSQSP